MPKHANLSAAADGEPSAWINIHKNRTSIRIGGGQWIKTCGKRE
jgi:hypothetical protein